MAAYQAAIIQLYHGIVKFLDQVWCPVLNNNRIEYKSKITLLRCNNKNQYNNDSDEESIPCSHN